MIADNRLTEIATWDDRLLAEQLQDLSLSGLDFSLDVIGFEMGEIDLRIASLRTCPPRMPTWPMSCPRSRRGRRSASSGMCGSWAASRLVRQRPRSRRLTMLMGEERAGVVFTDPPDNMPIDGHASGLGAIHHRLFPMAAGEMGKAELTAFLAQACRNLAAFSDAHHVAAAAGLHKAKGASKQAASGKSLFYAALLARPTPRSRCRRRAVLCHLNILINHKYVHIQRGGCVIDPLGR
jgi:hypothetical protein